MTEKGKNNKSHHNSGLGWESKIEEMKLLVEERRHLDRLSFTGFYLTIIFIGVFINAGIQLTTNKNYLYLSLLSVISSIIVFIIINWMSSIDQYAHVLIRRIENLEREINGEYEIDFKYLQSQRQISSDIRLTGRGTNEISTYDDKGHNIISNLKARFYEILKKFQKKSISDVAPVFLTLCVLWFLVSVIWLLLQLL